MVFYRKYRPQSLDELIGQEAVKSYLQSAFSGGKLSHAYLFCGPRGTGKTSTARILAKIVNCEATASQPCNKCDSCNSITDGSNLDLVEIDAASNRGIEDIRSLRENIKLSPTKAKKKIYIIDEVHMLTTEAFNALLKTLEEPPSHVLFILATTDPQKIPSTILSRVQRLDFKLASNIDLKLALQSIVEKEKLEVEEGVLEEIARRAQGSFRDGEKLLDQLSSLKKITLDDTLKFLSSSSFEDLVKILELVSTNKGGEALEKLNSILSTGAPVKELNLNLLSILRNLMLIKNGLEKLVETEEGTQRLQVLKELSEKFKISNLIRTLEYLEDSLDKLRYVSIPSLPLEVALIQSCMEEGDRRQATVDSKKTENVIARSEATKQSIQTEIAALPPVARNDGEGNDLQKIQERWNYVLETVRSFNFSLEALLKSSTIIECLEGKVVFEVPYSFHQRMMEAPKSKEMLEAILADILGKPVSLETILAKRVVSMDEIQNIEVAQDDEIIQIASEIFASEVN